MKQQHPRILALVSRPLLDSQGHPLDRLDLERESRQIKERLGEIEHAAEIRFDIAIPENLSRLLGQQEFDILHFTGHGGRGALAFEDGRGGVFKLDPDRLGWLAGSGGRAPFRLAFLSACHSESVAQALLTVGVPHVVAIDCEQPVLDIAARTFARNFYPALLAGRTVQEAFDRACAVVRAAAELPEEMAVQEALKFHLLPEDGNHTVPLFPHPAPGRLEDVTPAPPPNNLGARPETFVGRERELHQLIGLILSHRLVTVTGFGGMGKTELAREAGRWFRERPWLPEGPCFHDGIHFVEIRAIPSADQARVLIGSTLGFPPESYKTCQDLTRALAGSRRLLILDDLDEVVDADRKGVRSLLQALLDHADPCRFLVTTRLPAGGIPERLQRLHGMSFWEAAILFREWAILGAEAILPGPLAELYRLQAGLMIAYHDGRLTDPWGAFDVMLPRVLPDWHKVLDFLAGYPLAIRLAAAQFTDLDFSLKGLLSELEQRREELLHDPHLSPEERDKLDSVTVSLDLSYKCLRKRDAEAAAFFPLLSLFPGGVDEGGLETIFPGAWRAPLASLHRHSLVEHEPLTRRYFFPTPIRHYAERKRPADALGRYGPAALRYYLALTNYAAGELLPGPGYEEGMVLLGLELANIHAFLDWGYEGEKGEGQVSLAARLTAALRNFYVMADLQVKEGQRLEKALMAARRASDREGEANTLMALGDLALRVADLKGAEEHYRAALSGFRAIGDRLGEANTLKALGDLALRVADLKGAEEHYRAALSGFRAIGDRLGEANTLRSFGNLYLAQNEPDKAWPYLTQALEIHQGMDDRYSMALTLPPMAACLLAAGRSGEARQALETARALFAEIGLAGGVEWVEGMMQQLNLS